MNNMCGKLCFSKVILIMYMNNMYSKSRSFYADNVSQLDT